MRSTCIAFGLLLALGAAGAQAAPPTEEEEHLLGRLGYGHDRWTRARLAQLGLADYLEEQLHPDRVPDRALEQILRTDAEFDAWRMSLEEMRQTFGGAKARRPGELYRQARNELLLRAVVGRRQLETLLSEFWFNHFNVDLAGGEQRYLIPYVRDTLRPHLFGKFEDLLLAVARSPAMLEYLDNASNFKDGFRRGGQTLGINENYARELLELHTLGVDDQAGVYTQEDIVALARCLTGWTTSPRTADGFQFLAAAHDEDAKQVMRLRVPAGGGEQDGRRAIAYLATHPRTARNLCRKLVRFFVGSGEGELVTRATERYKATGGNLRAVLRVILRSGSLRTVRDTKVKRPTVLLASALRAADVDLQDGAERFKILGRVNALAEDLGLTVYRVPPPTGWEEGNRTFLDEGTLLTRFRGLWTLFAAGRALDAEIVASDPGTTTPPSDAVILRRLERRLFGEAALSAETKAAIEAYLSGLGANVATQDRAQRALALALSSPEFGRY